MGSSGSKKESDNGSPRIKAKIITVSHTWTISDSNLRSTNEVIKGSTFSSNGHEGIRWHLKLNPAWKDSENNDWVSLYLFMETCDAEGLEIQMRITLLNAKRRRIKTFASSTLRRFVPGANAGFKAFMTRDHLLSFLGNKELIIRCDVLASKVPVAFPRNRSLEVLKEKTCDPNPSSCAVV